jgi:hypothetical protein
MRTRSFSPVVSLAFLAVLGLCQSSARAQVVITSLETDPKLAGVIGLTTDGSRFFVTTNNGGGAVDSFSIGGGPITTLYNNLTSPQGIAVIGNNVFWIDPNSGPFTDPQILRAPKDGSGPITPIYTGSQLPSPHPSLDGSGLTTDGTRLYWSDEVGGYVFKINTDGSGVTQIGPQRYTGGFSTEHYNTIAYDNNTLYVADSGKTGVTAPSALSIGTSGSSFTTLAAGAPFQVPTGIAVGPNSLFVADAQADVIWSLPLTGGTPTVYASDSRFNSLHSLTYLNGDLYAADTGADTVWKISPATVPEPGPVTLMTIGAITLLGYHRVRSRSVKRSSQG